ncbi:hypothetical protein CAOG_09104, partial [Capsaspora owczarzaki ATCC 30864]|uniref:hypothetical protein n=2 Tax=Capsaspora owczarzaki (strain ATCC 30864) TaxID=595528 RepID=UPI0003522B2E
MSKVTTRVGTRKLNQNQAMPNNEQGVDTTAPTAGTSSATSAPAEPMSAQEMMRMMTQAMVSSMQEVVKEAMRKGTAEIAVSSHAASTTTASPTTSTELWRHGMQVTPFDGTLLDLERFVTDIRRKLESVTAPEKDKVDFVLGHLGVAARRYCSHVKFETAEALLEYIMNVYGVKNSKNNALREIIQAVADPKISARHFKKVMLLNVPKAELTDDLVRRFIVLQAEDKGVRDVAKELCKDTTEMTWIDALNELVESMPSKNAVQSTVCIGRKFSKTTPTRALFDSGSTRTLAASASVEAWGLEPHVLERPMTVRMVDTTTRDITHAAWAKLTIGKWRGKVLVYILPQCIMPLIIGMDVLQRITDSGPIRVKAQEAESAALLVGEKASPQQPFDPKAIPEAFREFAALFDPAAADKYPPKRGPLDVKLRFASGDVETPYRRTKYNEEERAALDEIIDNGLRTGKIVPAPGATNPSSVLFVKEEPEKKIINRVVFDLRGPNAKILSEVHDLPTVEDIMESMAGMTIFCKLDVSKAFNCIRLADEDSINATAFRTHRGVFKWTVLPFGIKVGSVPMQRLMDAMLRGLKGVAAYQDDIIVGGKNKEELIETPARCCVG